MQELAQEFHDVCIESLERWFDVERKMEKEDMETGIRVFQWYHKMEGDKTVDAAGYGDSSDSRGYLVNQFARLGYPSSVYEKQLALIQQGIFQRRKMRKMTREAKRKKKKRDCLESYGPESEALLAYNECEKEISEYEKCKKKRDRFVSKLAMQKSIRDRPFWIDKESYRYWGNFEQIENGFPRTK